MKRPPPEPSSPVASLSSDSSGLELSEGSGVSPDVPSEVELSDGSDSGSIVPQHIGAPQPVADSMAFGFTWPARMLSALRQELGDDAIVRGLCAPPQQKASTHFSGLGTAELAVDMINIALAAAFPRAQGSLGFVFACERSVALRRVLLRRAPDRCLFADLAARFSGVEPAVADGRLQFDRAMAAVRRAPMMHTMQCETHGSMCPLDGVQIDISGSPCTPWSRAVGATRLGREHPTTLLFLMWVRWVLSVKVRIAIHENVVGFDLSLLQESLGEEYWLEHVRVSPAHLGFPMSRRPRLYSISLRKACFRKPPDMQALFDRIVSRMAYHVLGDPFSWVTLATAAELAQEENRIRKQRGMEPIDTPSADWSYLLTDAQKRRLRQCKERNSTKLSKRADVYDLGQNPGGGNEVFCPGLPTLRRGSSRLWLASGQRWLLPAELRATMGFPTYRPLAQAACVAMDTSANEAMFATGNAMHVANVGAVIAIACCMAQPS